MATLGDINIQLDNIKDIINNSTLTASSTVGGVSDQGDLIGLAVGIAIAVTLLIGAIGTVFGFLWLIFSMVRRLKKEGR